MPQSPIPRLLNDHLPHESNASWYCGASIPAKKLRNAIKAYAPDVLESHVLALGDATIFGSAKEGVLLCRDTIYCATSEGNFSVLLDEISGARKLSGWPDYGIEVETFAGDIFRISATCFEKRQDGLVDFFNAISAIDLSASAAQTKETTPTETPNKVRVVRRRSRQSDASETISRTDSEENPDRIVETDSIDEPMIDEPMIVEPMIVDAMLVERSSVQNVNANLKLLAVCENEQYQDVNQLFDAAIRCEDEWPLVKGYCQYVGFNSREVDGIFLITNRRILIFSMEIGAKIVFVEVTRRLLEKLPVPFIDTIGCFFLFSIPRMIYRAMRGGHERLIEKALSVSEERLLSGKPGMRLVQSYDFARIAENVSQVDIGSGVWTGVLSRRFGISFAPINLSKTFRIPKDLILAKHETLEPFERLLGAIRETLRNIGLDYQLDSSGQKLSILPAAIERRAAA